MPRKFKPFYEMDLDSYLSEHPHVEALYLEQEDESKRTERSCKVTTNKMTFNGQPLKADGTEYQFFYPYRGSKNLFYCYHRQGGTMPNPAILSDEYLIIPIEIEGDSFEKAAVERDRQYKIFQDHIAVINARINPS